MEILTLRAIASALKYADTIALNAGVRKVCSRNAYQGFGKTPIPPIEETKS